jgi:hypothetical protein
MEVNALQNTNYHPQKPIDSFNQIRGEILLCVQHNYKPSDKREAVAPYLFHRICGSRGAWVLPISTLWTHASRSSNRLGRRFSVEFRVEMRQSRSRPAEARSMEVSVSEKSTAHVLFASLRFD